MVKTQVQLEEWQYEEAKKVGAAASRSLSDIVREGLTMVLRKVSQRAPQPLESLAGKYQPLNCQDLKKHDQGWSDSIR
jgi:hypothetical protein